MPILEVHQLSKRFGGVEALSQVDLTVEAGEVIGVIGPNGAGKSTFFNLLSGVMKPSAGKVVFQGHDVTGMKPHGIAKRGLVRTFQGTVLFSDLSVFDNVLVASHVPARANLVADVDRAAGRAPTGGGDAPARGGDRRTGRPDGRQNEARQGPAARAPASTRRRRGARHGPEAPVPRRAGHGNERGRDRGDDGLHRAHPPAGHHDPARRARDARGHERVRADHGAEFRPQDRRGRPATRSSATPP